MVYGLFIAPTSIHHRPVLASDLISASVGLPSIIPDLCRSRTREALVVDRLQVPRAEACRVVLLPSHVRCEMQFLSRSGMASQLQDARMPSLSLAPLPSLRRAFPLMPATQERDSKGTVLPAMKSRRERDHVEISSSILQMGQRIMADPARGLCCLDDVVERAADPLHRARIDTKSLGYLAHAIGTPWRLQSGADLRFQLRR